MSDKQILMRDRKRKIKKMIKCDTESSALADSCVAATLFTL